MNTTTGELFEGRCRATNLCTYCRTLYVVETVEMLTLDAIEHAPTLWLVLTAREHLTRAQCRDHLRQLRAAVRRRWAGCEWFVQVEFQRRGALHLNLLVKGVPVDEREQLHQVVVDLWCRRVDAEPVGQWSGVVEDGVGTVRYISKMLAHGLKAEQQPPIGWRGHRTSQTRGYLVRPASVMRAEARASLRTKRRLWRAFTRMLEITGDVDVPDLTEAIYEQLEARELDARYELVHVRPSLHPAASQRARPAERASGLPPPPAGSATSNAGDVGGRVAPPTTTALTGDAPPGAADLDPLTTSRRPSTSHAGAAVTEGEPAKRVDSRAVRRSSGLVSSARSSPTAPG